MANLLLGAALLLALVGAPPRAQATDLFDLVHHGYADNDGVKIHYVSYGRGDLIVFLHGFPDFWYGWRDQMAVLSHGYRVAALDLRGYNLSDKPKDVAQYNILTLAGDVAAVIRDLGYERATIVGHDWGGGIAWTFASLYPEMTERLVVLQTPHPRGLLRELRTDPAQQAASGYARNFQEKTAAEVGLTPTGLAALESDPVARARYVEAYERSDLDAMLDYYKANYPRAPYDDIPLPNIKAPTLVIHGLADPFLLAACHDGTYQWVDAQLTFVAVPGVNHFIQQQASALVTSTIRDWLRAGRRR